MIAEDEDRPLGSRARAAAVPSLETARRAALAPTGPDEDARGVGGVDEEYRFTLDHHDARRNIRWSGDFVCHVPSIAETIQIGKVVANLRGNIPPAALDDQTLNLTEMLGTLTVLCTTVPAWARGDLLLKMKDGGVAIAIYREVSAHIARFWGADAPTKDQADGAEREDK